jgi:acetylornithine deacetylase
MPNLYYSLSERVFKKIDENRDQIAKLVSQLVQIPSITGQEGDAQEFIKEKLTEMGLKVETFEPNVNELKDHPSFFETASYKKFGYSKRPNVIGIWEEGNSGKTLILNGHIDVVPSGPKEEWRYDPWGGEISNGKIYGRGSGDMKGGIVAMIYAVKAIQELEIPINGKVLVESTIEEEDGGIGGALATLLRGYTGNFSINPEPSGLDFYVASAGVLYFKIRVKGRPAHAKEAHKGVNAIDKIWLIYKALKELNEERQRRIVFPPAEECEPDVKGHVTTLNIGMISGGDWPSTVPAWAEIMCRIGWPPGESIREIESQILDRLKEVSRRDPWLRENPPEYCTIGWRAEPSMVNTSDPFVSKLSDLAFKVTGRRPRFCGGTAGLDTRFFINDFNIPSVGYGPIAHNIHGINEFVELDSVIQVAKVIALAIVELLTE